MRKGAVKRRPSSHNSLAAVGKGALGVRALRSNKPVTNKVRFFVFGIAFLIPILCMRNDIFA